MNNLDVLLKNLNKKMKVGNIQIGVEFQEIEKIPFSSCRLNYMTYGGLPTGRIAEFSGAEGSGKTTTALDIVGQCQKKFPDKKVLFVDIESTFDSSWALKMGVDIDNLVLFRPDSQGAEEVFQIMLDIMDTGDISLVVLDSIGAMVSGLANEKDMMEKTYGGISQSLTLFVKKATPICARTNCTMIGINQIRDDMNSMYGGTITTGGRAWKHACTTRLSFRHGVFIDSKGNQLSRACENPQGQLVQVHLDKSKVCPPDRNIGFYTLMYLEGIDYVADAFDVAVKLGIIKQAGSWYTLIDSETGDTMFDGDGKELKVQGKNSFVSLLKSNELLYNYVVDSIKEKQETEK